MAKEENWPRVRQVNHFVLLTGSIDVFDDDMEYEIYIEHKMSSSKKQLPLSVYLTTPIL